MSSRSHLREILFWNVSGTLGPLHQVHVSSFLDGVAYSLSVLFSLSYCRYNPRDWVVFLSVIVDVAPLGVLPLVDLNFLELDAQDTWTYISTYRLHRHFDFVCLLNERKLYPKDVYPLGDYIVVDASVAFLTNHFPHFTKNQLVLLGKDHAVALVSGARKEVHCHSLRHHSCASICTWTPFVFRQRSHARIDATKPVFPSGEELAKHKRHFIESRRRRNAKYCVQPNELQEQVDGVLYSFPPSVTQNQRNAIVDEWMQKMDLSNFHRKSCAVCGQRRCSKDIKVVPADDVNFSLLRNPCIPEKCRPTNYNIGAYDGAILWYKALHDRQSRGDVDMCLSCSHELVSLGKQPIDSLANFQYYGHEALPDPVRRAFSNATTFDVMLVA